MLTIDQIRKILSDRNLNKVARDSGVSPASVYRLMKADGKPLYDTVKALSDYLQRGPQL